MANRDGEKVQMETVSGDKKDDAGSSIGILAAWNVTSPIPKSN
jgi:hypothetical protein